MLFGRNPAEIIALCLEIGLVVKHRRMAGMGHKIRQVVALWQVSGKRGRGVQHHDHRSRFQFPFDRASDLPDRGIRNRQDHDFGPVQCFVRRHTRQTQAGLQLLLSRGASLHVADLERCGLEIAGQPVPHLAACPKQRNFRAHRQSPRTVVWQSSHYTMAVQVSPAAQ